MKSHEFAKNLLAGPDLPIGLPPVKEYDTDDERIGDPVVSEVSGENASDGSPVKILIISQAYRPREVEIGGERIPLDRIEFADEAVGMESEREQHLLVILGEEAAEVAHRAAKAFRFGLGEVQDGKELDNRARLEGEIADLMAVAEELGLETNLRSLIAAKKKRLREWMDHSVLRGRLKSNERE